MSETDEQNGSDRSGQVSLRLLLGFLPFAVTGIIWFVLVHGFSVRAVFLPPIEQMPAVIWGMFVNEGIVHDILISCVRVITGFVIAMVLATPVGILMGYNQRAQQMFEPIIGFIRYMPVPVFIPLCILWFGSGDMEKIIIIF